MDVIIYLSCGVHMFLSPSCLAPKLKKDNDFQINHEKKRAPTYDTIIKIKSRYLIFSARDAFLE